MFIHLRALNRIMCVFFQSFHRHSTIMKTITLKLLLAFVVVMSVVMIGSSMAHQHQTYLLTAAEEEATTNESDTKLVAAANNNRNAAAVFDGASAFTRLWTQLVSGYDWMTRQLTDNSDVEFEETRESKGNIFHLTTLWVFSSQEFTCGVTCTYVWEGISYMNALKIIMHLRSSHNVYEHGLYINPNNCHISV